MTDQDREIARLLGEIRLLVVEKASLRIENNHLRAELRKARERIEAAKLDAASVINPGKEPPK